MDYGLQLFSVRDITEQDLAGALCAVRKAGYAFVEFAGFFGHTPEQVNAMLAENQLRLSGTHTGWQELEDDLEGTIAFHQAIGNKNLIIPGAELETKAKLDAFIDFVNEVQPKLAQAGIALHYHNHDFEFRANEDGNVPYSELALRTELLLEIDTYWVYAAGLDPVELLERYGSRVQVLHLKDGLGDGTGKPLGLGTAPVKAVWTYAKEHNIPMVVESETLAPDGITEAQICMDYLREIEE